VSCLACPLANNIETTAGGDRLSIQESDSVQDLRCKATNSEGDGDGVQDELKNPGVCEV